MKSIPHTQNHADLPRLKVNEAASDYGVPANTIHWWLDQGHLESEQAPNRIHSIKRLDLVQLLLSDRAGENQIPATEIPIGSLSRRPEFQPRPGTDTATVESYTTDLLNGEPFQPGVAADLNGVLVLLDGHHRYEAHDKAGLKTMKIRVIKHLSEDEAVLLAFILNRKNARQLSESDKRHALKTMLSREGVRELGFRRVAEMTGCSAMTVQRVNDSLTGRVPKPRPGSKRNASIRHLEKGAFGIADIDPDEAKEIFGIITKLKLKGTVTS